MKRLDFEVVAQAMNDSKPRGATGMPGEYALRIQWEKDCLTLADAFAKQTHCFERDRFLRNCGHAHYVTLPRS